MYAGSAVPAGWLLCNGQAVSRATFSALFTAIGVAFGAGDNSTTFNVPDLRDRLPIGVGLDVANNTLGQTTGARDVTLSAAQSGVPAHAHTASSGIESTAHAHAFSDHFANVGLFTSFQIGNQGHSTVSDALTANATDNESANHNHAITVNANAAAAASASHTNMPPVLALNFIIKT